MSAYAESHASFKHRALEIGLSNTEVTSLIDQSIKSFNNLAFAVCGQPGQLDDTRFRQLTDAAFTNPSLGLESMLRQLSYEAITVAVAAIRQRVDTPVEGQLRKLPPQERDERAKRLAAKITGFSIQGEYEPAHVVVDFFTTMLEEGAPKYLPLSRCISREQELQSQRSDRRIVVLEDQQLQVKHKAPDLTADLSTDLKVQNAFIRRGLACEQAGLFTHDTHEKLRHEFMAHMMRTPPPNFKAPDIASVLRADKELWMRAFEKCKSGIKPDATGAYPLGEALLEFQHAPQVVFHLLPTPTSSGTKRGHSPPDDDVNPNVKKNPKDPKRVKKGDPPKKTGSDRVKVPDALRGFSGLNKSKMRICYNFNLPHGCSNSTHEKDGHTRCVKGCHECIKCGGKHAVSECQKK